MISPALTGVELVLLGEGETVDLADLVLLGEGGNRREIRETELGDEWWAKDQRDRIEVTQGSRVSSSIG